MSPSSVQPSPFTEAQAASLAVAYKLILTSRRQREAQADNRQKEDAPRE